MTVPSRKWGATTSRLKGFNYPVSIWAMRPSLCLPSSLYDSMIIYLECKTRSLRMKNRKKKSKQRIPLGLVVLGNSEVRILRGWILIDINVLWVGTGVKINGLFFSINISQCITQMLLIPLLYNFTKRLRPWTDCTGKLQQQIKSFLIR